MALRCAEEENIWAAAGLTAVFTRPLDQQIHFIGNIAIGQLDTGQGYFLNAVGLTTFQTLKMNMFMVMRLNIM